MLGEAWLRALLAGVEAESGWDLREAEHFVGTSAGSIVAAVLAGGRRPETAGAVVRAWEDGAAAAGAGEQAAAAAAAVDEGGRSPTTRAAGDPGLGSDAPAGARARAGRLAGALAAPVAPATAAALAPGRAALRAALLRAGATPTREIPQLRAALERLGARFDGRLRVAAVDRRSGRRVIFGAPGAPEASVTDAVLASCAVPWVFRPRTIGGREYVDGGVWSAANLDAAPVRAGTEVLCLNPTATPRLARDRLGATRAFARTTAGAEALVLRRRGAAVTIVEPDAATVEAIGPSLFDARRRAAVEAAGYAQGRALAR